MADKEAQELTDKALEMISDVFFVFDLEGRFIKWNRRLSEVTGYSDDEIAGMRPMDLFAGDDVQRVAHAFGRVMELGEVKLEAQFTTKDGRSIPYEFTGSLLKDSHEKPYAIAGTGRDISERKNAEETLRKSEERFRDMALSSAGFLWETDGMGRYTYCSERVKDVLGYEPEEMLGRTAMEFLAKDEMARIGAVFSEIVTNGEPMRDIETRSVTKDGREVILQTNGIPVLGDDGVLLGHRGVCSDVTARRNAEEKLTWELEVSAALVDLKSAMLSSATFEEISAQVLETAISLTGSVFGFTGYIDPKTGFLVSPTLTRNAWETCQIDKKEAVVFDKFGGLWGWVLDNKRSVLVNEVAADPRSSGTPEGHIPITRFLSAPALIGDELVGQIAIANRDTDYTEEDLELIERLARIFALEIQRQHADDALRESEERYRTLYESSQDALMILSPPSWKFTSCNPMAMEMFGAKDERELTSVGPGEVSPDLQPDGRASADKAGEMIEAALRDGSSLFEWTHQRLDGADFPATVLLTRMEIGGEKVMQATVRDITDSKAAEESLRDSKEELQAIYDGIGDGVMVLDLETGTILRANPALALMLGYSQEELAGMAAASVHPPDEFQRVGKEMEKGRAGENRVQELACLRKDGSVFLADLTGMTINYQGRLCGVAIFRDVTERKTAEEELRRTGEYLESLLDYANAPIIVWDNEFKVQRFNHAFERLAGYEADEVINRELSLLFPVETREESLGKIERTLSGERWESVEIPILRKDGSMRVALWNSANIYEKDGKTIIATIAQGQDITERKATEEALRESEERFRQFADNLPEVVFEADSMGRFLYVNSNALEVFGYTEAELYSGSLTVLEMIAEEYREQVVQRMQKVLSEGAQGSSEYMARRKDGSVFPAIISTLPVVEDGIAVGLRGVLTDATAPKEAEDALVETNRQLEEATAQANEMAVQAESASRAKSEFLANMSHEIRTPLNGVIGMSELLLDSELTTEQREYTEALRRSGEDLLAIINDILDFSKIEARKMELSPAPFMLRENTGTTMKALAIRANEKGLELVVEILEEVPDRLVGDWGRLRQVLVNLVGNAIKFTEKGEIVLSIELESQKNGSVVLAFSVSDTGIGIPYDHQESIFSSFTQVDSSTTRVYGGTGLGLTISAQLVEMMGGAISVESEPDSGSTFTFDARLALDTEPPELVARLEPPDLQGLRVLVVDDNATNRRVLEGMLGNWGMAPTSCASSFKALRAMEAARSGAEEFGLVLLDLRMPVMDGFEFAERVRNDPAYFGIAIILLTSAVRPEDSTRIAELKIARSITKPVAQSELLDAIIDALSEERNAEPEAELEPEAEPEAGARYRILLAEDNEINRRVASKMLERAGHTVLTATDGGEAVAAFARGHFDLVLMDMQMPVMDGIQATAAIRSTEKDTGRHVPIVALTAHTMKGDEERFLEAGMDGYLPKPITFESLYETIERLMGSGSVDALHEVAGEEPGGHIDEGKFLRQMGGDRDLAREVVQLYFKHYPGRLRDIARAVSAGDAEQLNRTAHALKGSVSNLAADRASELAYMLERMGEEGDLEAAVEVLEDLEVELDAIAAFFREGGWADEP